LNSGGTISTKRTFTIQAPQSSAVPSAHIALVVRWQKDCVRIGELLFNVQRNDNSTQAVQASAGPSTRIALLVLWLKDCVRTGEFL